MADAPPETGGTGLNKKIGGYPAWAWVTVTAGGVIVLWLWSRRKSAGSGGTNSSTNPQYTPSGNEGLSTDQYEALLAQLRDIQASQSGESEDKDTTGGKKNHDIRITTDGKLSLNQIAAAHHTSAAAIVETTKKHGGITGKFKTYVTKHHFTVKVPAGLSLWLPNDSTPSSGDSGSSGEKED